MIEPRALLSSLQSVVARRPVRRSLFVAACVLLAAILGYLYYKTQGVDIKRASEVLAALRELKEIDARWDVEILRLRAEPVAAPTTPADVAPMIGRLRKEL